MDNKEAEIIEKAITHWQSRGIINEDTAARMKADYEPARSSSQVLTTYALVACVSCGLLAFGALVMDEKWIELIRRKFDFSEIVVGSIFLLITILLAWLSKRRIAKRPDSTAGNEAFNITIVLSLAVALAYIGRSIGYQNGNYAPLLLVAAAAYGTIGYLLQSKLLWTVMLLSLSGWWGAQTYYWSGGADYFLGMNYALRMTLFGLLILAGSLMVAKVKKLTPFSQITQVFGWISFLIASWSLSILGNSSSIDVWMQIRQGALWYWALGFTLMLLGLIFYAFKKDNSFLRDAALVFFLINIYTRYFEYFWDKTNKGLFFAILAISFWWLGRTAEKWRSKVQSQK